MAVNPYTSSMALAFVLLLLLLRPTLAEDGEELPVVDEEASGHGEPVEMVSGMESDQEMFGDYPEGPLPDNIFPPLGDLPDFVEPPGELGALPLLAPDAYILPPIAEMDNAIISAGGWEGEAPYMGQEEDKTGVQGTKNASQGALPTNPSLLLLALAAFSSVFSF